MVMHSACAWIHRKYICTWQTEVCVAAAAGGRVCAEGHAPAASCSVPCHLDVVLNMKNCNCY
jgi:hypothetical protein